MTISTINVGCFTITMLMICLIEVKNKNRKHAAYDCRLRLLYFHNNYVNSFAKKKKKKHNLGHTGRRRGL